MFFVLYIIKIAKNIKSFMAESVFHQAVLLFNDAVAEYLDTKFKTRIEDATKIILTKIEADHVKADPTLFSSQDASLLVAKINTDNIPASISEEKSPEEKKADEDKSEVQNLLQTFKKKPNRVSNSPSAYSSKQIKANN